ncbi:helix-turn-helix transcriptional regulator [Streptomyces sp. ITFR-6]|uniref:helix-turn-helix domain-containing protein n=1 Tax=Streptomyces sp. ITFR-6 TaxID=3075197 RepID=UPI00288940C5|nr:helix-turn-helix transcriptional regulator [Streptomyces sp. ITFR-6]WNI30006.1 helix-turn-helix transcriptional regulator [Streptomyces sp. ITFR-6]
MTAVGTSGETTHGRRLVGELIRIHRVRAGLTQKEAAERLLISESLMGAVERGERIPSRDLLIDADEVFGAGGALKACCELVDEEKYPAKFLDWAKLERAARVISAYETMLIPGLLQTEGYAYALYGARVPAYSETEIIRHVEARLERQAVFSRTPPPRVGYVIEESVLDRPLGGAEVLKEQLRHVIDCMARFNHLTVQVMPTAQHTHAGLNGPMKLMATEQGRHLVYEEGQGGATLISKPERVSDLFDLFGTLRAQALTPWQSAELIEKKAAKL